MVPVPTSDPAPLVEKYKPTSTKKIIGQQGPNNCVEKLSSWLRNWYRNYDRKPAPGKFGSDDGAGYRAALLSGPPGIGKTTSAHLLCKELGFSFVEFNASDTRNKSSLESEVRSLLANSTLSDFSNSGSLTKQHVLIMDEVDGMAGNEDRGGIAELIQLIKKTRVPIICICNDRSHQKIRSLVNYCYDIRFFKPKPEQIKGAMLSICYKEGIKISSDALMELIISSNYDIRQTLHYLSLMVNQQSKTPAMKPGVMKDIKMGPFDAVKTLFNHTSKPMSFNDRADLFFSDYSLIPLFVYENYPNVYPHNVPRTNIKKRLELGAKAAEAIAFGNLVENESRSSNNWSLLPLQAAFAAVLPSYYLSGNLGGFIEFPKLLGKISTINKNDRLIQELKMHMSLRVSSSKTAVNLEYIPALINKIYKPLKKCGVNAVDKVLEVMNYYSIRKEDLDTMLEMLWSNQKNPAYDVDPKTKGALTRACNTKGELLPYTEIKGKKIRKRTAAESLDLDGDGEDEESGDEEEPVIKPKKVAKRGEKEEKSKKAPAKKSSPASKSSPSKRGTKRARSPSGTRGRGRGRKK